MRLLRIPLLCSAALLLACGRNGDADVPAADTSAAAPQMDSVEVVARVGRVTVEHLRVPDRGYWPIREARLKVDGRAVLVEELTEGMHLEAYWPVGEARALYLIANNPGGTACDAKFRVLDLPPHGDGHLSEEFGSCTWAPDTLWFDGSGALWMRFPAWSRVVDEMDPEWVPGPPETWVYRGAGRLEAR